MATDPECHYAAYDARDDHLIKINQHFYDCIGKDFCKFSLGLEDMFPKSCVNKIRENGSSNQQVYAVVQCFEDQIKNPFTGESTNLSREELGTILVLIDMLCIIIFILATLLQEKISEVAIEEFRDLSMAVSEFAVEVTNLPPIAEYKNEKILKAVLWEYFNRTVSTTPQQISIMEKKQKYHSELVDIYFGYRSNGHLNELVKIKAMMKKLKQMETKAANTGKDLEAKIKDLSAKIEKKKTDYGKSHKLTQGKAGKENIKMAFVMFRSMEGRQRAIKAHQRPGFFKKMCTNKKLLKQEVKFMDKYALNVEAATEADLIKW